MQKVGYVFLMALLIFGCKPDETITPSSEDGPRLHTFFDRGNITSAGISKHQICFLKNNGEFGVYRTYDSSLYFFNEINPVVQEVRQIERTSDDEVAINSLSRGIIVMDNRKKEEYYQLKPDVGGGGYFTFDNSSQLAAVSHSSVFLYRGWQAWLLTPHSLQGDRSITCVSGCADTAWIGTIKDGVKQVSTSRKFIDVPHNHFVDKEIKQIKALSVDSVFVLSSKGLSLRDHGVWTQFYIDRGLTCTSLTVLNGKVYIGTNGGLYRPGSNNRLIPMKGINDQLPFPVINKVTHDEKNIWLATGIGLHYFKPD